MHAPVVLLTIGAFAFANAQPTAVQVDGSSHGSGSAVLIEEKFEHRNASSCAVKITGFGGWSGILGPWDEPCETLKHLDGKWQVSDEEQTAMITIDPATMALHFTNLATHENLACKLTGLSDGDGCKFPQAVSQPTKKTVPLPCTTSRSTVGGASGEDPIQWLKHRKLSTNIKCDAAGVTSCSVGSTDSISYTEGFDFSISPIEWISGGFSVSKSVSTGNSYTCTIAHGHAGCIFKKTQFTQYGARNKEVVTCPSGATTTYKPLRIRSPHTSGGSHYCETDAACGVPQGSVTWNQV